MTPYEEERDARIKSNALRMKELGVAEAASKVATNSMPTKKRKSNVGAESKAKKAAPAEPTRRSSRARGEVSYKEPTMKDFEDIAAMEEDPGVRANAAAKAAYSKERRSGYDPKAPKQGFKPALDLSEGVRDKKTGKLVFKDHPEFTPNLTPKQVIQAGTWGGCYFHPRGGKQGIRGPCNITHEEFPKDWFAGLKPDQYRSRRYDKDRNKYGVVAGQDQAYWEEHGWIIPQDPRGWFQWYCRYSLGRRIPDIDDIQIKRWRAFARHAGQIKANCEPGDIFCRPRQRQALLQWSYDPFI